LFSEISATAYLSKKRCDGCKEYNGREVQEMLMVGGEETRFFENWFWMWISRLLFLNVVETTGEKLRMKK